MSDCLQRVAYWDRGIPPEDYIDAEASEDPVAEYCEATIGAKPGGVPGQKFNFTSCDCGLLLLRAPCLECSEPATRYSRGVRHTIETPAPAGAPDRLPTLVAVLCFMIVLWIGVRIDTVEDARPLSVQPALD